jgi:hypothetical protein
MYASIKNVDAILNMLIKFSRVLCWVNFLEVALLVIRSGNNTETHSMTIGYNLALCGVFLFYAILKNHYIYDKVIFLILLFLIVFYGNRGALLVVVLAMIVMFYHENKNKILENRRSFILYSLCILLLLVFIIFRDKWLQGINSIANLFGVSSRNLNKLLEGSFSDDNGRDIYHLLILSRIKQMPIWGYGLLSDRYFLNNAYVHSLYLEILCDYGYLIGGFILTTILFSLIKTLKNVPEKRALVLLLSIFSITQLSFSSSFTLSIQFYVLLGLIFDSVNTNNIRYKNEFYHLDRSQ